MFMRLTMSATLSSVALLGASCDHASFTYVDNDPPPRVTVVERRPPRDVVVVEHHRPADEVHVVHTQPVREVHVVEKPIVDVHVHQGHCCTPACNHYWDGSRYVVVSRGHRHGPGCGHHYDGRRWGIEVHKAKANEPPPPRKYKRN